MSYTSNIGGKLIVNAKGSIKTYAKEDIELNSAKTITLTGKEKGVSFGKPKSPPKPQILAKCVVLFRPKNGWLGEDYGFDWMRQDDTSLITGGTSFFGDVKYEGIVAKQYKEAAFTNLVTDGNKFDGHFKKNAALYSKLKNEYKPHTIPWRAKKDAAGADLRNAKGAIIPEDYFCPWLSLFPKEIEKTVPQGAGKPPLKQKVASGYNNTIAKLSLILDVEEEADTLKFENNKYFKITPQEIAITGKAKGKHTFVDHITIECLSEFTNNQTIVVNAIKKGVAPAKDDIKVAGKLNVWANHTLHRKKAKVLLIDVTTNTSSVKAGNSAGQKDLFEKYLRQALIETKVVTETLNLSTDANLQTGGKYVIGGKIAAYYDVTTNKPAGFVDLESYLYTQLKAQIKAVSPADENKYANYFIAYYLGENGGYVDASGVLKELNGFSSGKKVMLFPAKNDQTAAHEFLHSFNLPHSFTNTEADANASFTFEYAKTENLMDYSHRIGKTRSSLWHWQWIKANASIR
jgi:hypothetical protein